MPGRFRRRAVVLLVEDNPDDVIMIREAFEQSLTPVQPDFDGFADVIRQVATCFLGLISLPPQ